MDCRERQIALAPGAIGAIELFSERDNPLYNEPVILPYEESPGSSDYRFVRRKSRRLHRISRHGAPRVWPLGYASADLRAGVSLSGPAGTLPVRAHGPLR